MKKIIFINSHPIQYFAPLYQFLASSGKDIKVYYCSAHGLQENTDKEFGTNIKWDIPLLSGYDHVFLKSNFRKPSIYGFFGLINLGIIKELARQPKSILIVHGWSYFTHILTIIAGRFFGHIVCLRAETPLSHELKRSVTNLRVRKFILRYLFFPWFHRFLYIGAQNKAFYKFYKVPDHKLLYTPYAVDNDRFSRIYGQLLTRREVIRRELGIAPGGKAIIVAGKYIAKKRPLDIIKAFARLQRQYGQLYLFMVGEGELRIAMEELINKEQIANVRLTGFINQQAIPQYYMAGDIFVMCSDIGETWGLATNEAMNFHLPVILSDLTGCAQDLVKPGSNGYIFETGNIDDLAQKISLLLSGGEERLKEYGDHSKNIVEQYSFKQIGEALSRLACEY